MTIPYGRNHRSNLDRRIRSNRRHNTNTMRSGISSLFFILPLLAGLSERFIVHASPQSASADRAALEAQLQGLLSPFRFDPDTPDCSADGSDGYQVQTSQDASPVPLVFAGWEGVLGDFGDVKPVSRFLSRRTRPVRTDKFARASTTVQGDERFQHGGLR
jgi:hypothetical protein